MECQETQYQPGLQTGKNHGIMAAYESGGVNPKWQKMRKTDNEKLDKAVYTWFQALMQIMFQCQE